MERKLIRHLEARGYQARLVSLHRLHGLREALESNHRQGLFEESFYQERLTGFDFEPPSDLPGAQSLIIVAFADPPVRFSFTRRGEQFQRIVPPTYLHWEQKDQQVQRVLEELLEPAGYQAAPAVVPKKLLATCSGLATYGRNNITYARGLGSFHRLAAFCSDMPCERGHWQEPQVLDQCANCQACRRACPTGAIGEDRFLLHAERCLTFLNEKPATVPFPDWLSSSSHTCLVGCMRCQAICPENRDVRNWIEEGEEFSERETDLLLSESPIDELPASLRQKLERSDLMELLEFLPRNLSALLASPQHG